VAGVAVAARSYPVRVDAKTREGKRVTFRVTLGSASSQPLSYAFVTRKGTARPGRDFKATRRTVTFAAGETSKRVRVKTRSDQSAETKERFFVEVSYPGGPSDGGRAKIIDND
jgi:hypothetical protein